MSTIWRTSASRPITGSSSPFRARSVRLIVYWSRAGVRLKTAGLVPAESPGVDSEAGPSSSLDPAASFRRLDWSCSPLTLLSSREASRASRASSSSSSSASRSTPERIFDSWNWIDDKTQA